MQNNNEYISQLRKTGFFMSSIAFFATVVFYFLGESSTFIQWIITTASWFVYILLSYKFDFLKRNLENFYYFIAVIAISLTYYDTYISDLTLLNAVPTLTIIYLIANVDFRSIRKFGIVMILAFLAQAFVSYSFFGELPEESMVALLFGSIAIVASFYYTWVRIELLGRVEQQTSIPKANPNSVIELNEKKEIIFINDATKEYFPDLKSKGIKHSLFYKIDEVIAETKKSKTHSIQRRIKFGEKAFQQKIVFYAPDKTLRIYSTDISDILSVNLQLKQTQAELENEQQKLINLIDDLTKEKDYESIRNKVLVENINEGIILTDEYGSINYVNSAIMELLKYDEKDLIGKDISEAFVAFDLNDKQIQASSLSNNAAITSSQQEMKIKIQTKDGERIPVDVRSAEVRISGQYKGVVRIIHDITEEVNLAQQKDDFFSIASHELRTPLTVISGNIDIILQGYSNSRLSKDDKELLEDTLSASDRLIRMVNDFLNVSRLDQGRLQYHMEEINPCEVSESVAKELKPLADEKGIELAYSCDKSHNMVLADEGLLKEIIINLTGNSIKFTEKGSVTISNSIEKGLVTIRVTDTGAGIEKDKQGKLFGRFQQVMSKTLSRQAGGTGLGLYISREFARKMGGDLILEKSVYGKGSTFRLTLPAVASENKKNKKKIKAKTENIEDE